MSQQIINIGAAPNDGTGDQLRVSFDKCNDNFAELYKGAGSEGGLWNYNKTSTDTSTSPVSGRFRTNSGDYLNATQIAIHGTSIQGIDRSNMLRTLLKNDLIKLQDSLDGNAWCRYILRGPPVDHITWFQLDIDLESSGSVTSGDNQEINFVFTANSIGGMSGSAEYRFNSAVQTPPPASGYIRINNVSMTATTALYVNKITDTAADIGQLLLSISIGTVIVIQDNANSANYGKFQTTAACIDGSTYVEIPVTSTGSGGSIANNERVIFGILGSAAAGGGGNVNNVGTPTNGQLAQWTDATHIQGIDVSSLGYAPLASPAFTGNPTAPNQSTADNSTRIATTAFVQAQGYITSLALVPYAPLASPGLTGNPTAPTPLPGDNDASIATTAFVTTAIAGKADLASPTFTGDPKAPTPATADNDTSIATTAFVKAQGYVIGGPFQPLDGDLTAIAALTGTNNIYYRSATDTWSPVTMGGNMTFAGGVLNSTGITPPQRTVLTSGSGTYTTPSGCTWLEVEMCGGGGGGASAGGGGSPAVAGGNGVASTFGSLTANGGVGGGATGSGSTGGTASGGDVNLTGSMGSPAAANVSLTNDNLSGGSGGPGPWGGCGSGGFVAGGGISAPVNSGGGGGGGGLNTTAGVVGGGGGGAGGYCRKIFAPPSASYAWAVGTGGGGGSTGTAAGGNGGSGIIIVTAHFGG